MQIADGHTLPDACCHRELSRPALCDAFFEGFPKACHRELSQLTLYDAFLKASRRAVIETVPEIGNPMRILPEFRGGDSGRKTKIKSR